MSKVLKFFIYFILIFIIHCTPESQKEVVAQWSDVSIFLSDFERSYFNQWQLSSQSDSPKLRRAHAQRMIEQELIATNGILDGSIDENAIAPFVLKDMEYFLRRRYLEITVKDSIPAISNQETELALARLNKSMRVRQLYGRTKEEILELEQRLQWGEKFEMLARQTMPDPLIAYREGDLGWINWGDTDLPIENVLHQLKKGEISKPVQSLMGWHIFRIDSEKVTMDFNTANQPLLRKEISQKLFNRKLDMAAAYHYRELVWSKSLAINAKLFKDIWDYLKPIIPKNAKEGALKGFKNLEVNLKRDLSEQIVARFDNEPFTVGEFISAVPYLPRDLLRPNLKKAIEVAVRDKIVVQKALSKGIDRDPVVKEKVNRSKITFSYYAALANADSIAERKVNLRDYYSKNKERYIDRIESEIEDIQVKDQSLAFKITEMIQQGKNFADLANRYSQNNAVRKRGGYLGYVSNKENPLGEKAAELKQGDIFAPVKTVDGYHVIRVGKQNKYYLSFENIKTKIAQDAQKEYYALLHKNLLPKNYRPEDIIFYNLVLDKAFTDKSGTIF